MLNIKSSTPQKITDKIIGFCKKVSGEMPFYVNVSPIGNIEECYLNCINYVEENTNASIVWGWAIWEGNFILELEHHSIIKLNDGTYLDPTTTVDKEDKILFLPHNNLAPTINITKNFGLNLFTGYSYHNVIFPNVNYSKTRPFMTKCPYDLDSASKKLEILKSYTPKENPKINSVKIGRNELCSCGSNKKFKKCCGN